ncbi:tyrosine-type recombinase/integrase [Halobacillus litoralis]|uniref:Integrase n=1 Tax=Halobacillus litoralis TaxID=45668 RepID=A0A410MAR1_9BACI|nr:tyrosine-type recombinase/integrase [Halobacillus litoralis]QAS51834.1 integrase [Halobacillus litoralis]
MKRRKELSEEEMDLIRNKVTEDEALEKFFKDCCLRNLRPATIEYYKNEFHATKKMLKKDLVDIKQEDIEAFIVRSKTQISITTINTRLRALRAFYNYLKKNKLISTNPMKNIKLLRDRQKVIETLDNQEIEKLVTIMRNDRTFVSFRNEVILLVFLDTGIRLSELVGIEVEDVATNHIVIRKTKNLYQRIVYLSERTQEQLRKYLVIRGDVEGTNKLFINRDNNELKPHSIQTGFTSYGKRAGISKRVSPHTFRHTMAKRMIMAGADAFTLMTILGHSDMTITKKYVYLWGPDIEKKHKQYSALKGLKF